MTFHQIAYRAFTTVKLQKITIPESDMFQMPYDVSMTLPRNKQAISMPTSVNFNFSQYLQLVIFFTS